MSKLSDPRQLRRAWRIIRLRRRHRHADFGGQVVVFNAYTVCWLAAVGSLEERLGMNPKLVPNTQERVPGSRRYRHTILRNAQARNTIVVAGENSCNHKGKCVPGNRSVTWHPLHLIQQNINLMLQCFFSHGAFNVWNIETNDRLENWCGKIVVRRI